MVPNGSVLWNTDTVAVYVKPGMDSSEHAQSASDVASDLPRSFFDQYSEQWNQERLKDISCTSTHGKTHLSVYCPSHDKYCTWGRSKVDLLSRPPCIARSVQ